MRDHDYKFLLVKQPTLDKFECDQREIKVNLLEITFQTLRSFAATLLAFLCFFKSKRKVETLLKESDNMQVFLPGFYV